MQEMPVRFLGWEDPWRRDRLPTLVFMGFPGGSDGKESALQPGRPGFDPWVGKIPWRRVWLTHSSILAWRIPLDRGAWQATVHGVTKSRTRLSNKHKLNLDSNVTSNVKQNCVYVCKHWMHFWHNKNCVIWIMLRYSILSHWGRP